MKGNERTRQNQIHESVAGQSVLYIDIRDKFNPDQKMKRQVVNYSALFAFSHQTDSTFSKH